MADLVFKGVGKARAGREHVRGAGPSASRLGASPSFFDLYRCDVFVLLDVSAGLRLGLERDDVEDVTLVRLVRAPAVRSGEGELGRPTVALDGARERPALLPPRDIGRPWGTRSRSGPPRSGGRSPRARCLSLAAGRALAHYCSASRRVSPQPRKHVGVNHCVDDDDQPSERELQVSVESLGVDDGQ